MRIRHVKRSWSRPLFMKWGKHYCPVCNEVLKKIKVSKVVNSESEEANNFDFSSVGGDGYMVGNVEFTWMEFCCSKCEKNYSMNDIYRAEKN